MSNFAGVSTYLARTVCVSTLMACIAACTHQPASAPVASAGPAPATTPGANTAAAQDDQERAQRMAWWTDARFGLFIHWGLYAVPAGQWKGKSGYGEWIQEEADIPRDEYAKFTKDFNPVRYNPDAWARMAKDAGMKYVVLTSKHHEGFALWDTKGTDFNIAKRTAYGKGVIKPLADAVRRQGLHFGLYYSIMDWRDPSQRESKPNTLNPTLMDPAQKARYVQDMKTQLKELIEQTDPEVLWFDGEWVDWWTREDALDMVAYLHGLKPNIIINNRVFNSRNGMSGISPPGSPGDFFTPEQEVPAAGFGPQTYWESCMTMNKVWGYVNDTERDWKSTTTLIRHLVDAASKGGNYLLNVGPTPQGEFPERAVQRLDQIGQWMRVNGEAIYQTQASPITTALPWGRITRKADRLYLHVFDWPKNGRLQLPWTHKVDKAWLLAAPDQTISVTQDGPDTVLQLPARAPDAAVSVIALQTNTGTAP